jgi:hypothetical protein
VWLLGNNLKKSKCEPFLSMILVDCYLIMDLGHWFDDIVTGIETILTGKDLEVTAMIIKLEYMDLILFYLYMHMVSGKTYKSFTRCHDGPSGLDIVFNS